MPLTLAEALETSAALEERLASAPDDNLLRRKAMVDCAAFELFKTANAGIWNAMKTPLAWGAGLGLPALAVGHTLLRDANNQAQEVVRDARNQALITAAGAGGLFGVGTLLRDRLNRPQNVEETHQVQTPGNDPYTSLKTVKFSEDETVKKLAAAITVDDVLVKYLETAKGEEKTAAEECLLLNRMHGVALLRKLQ